ncbi:hypothetical protein OSSY52_16510 [Tepiditoga spiralis]|uniref:Hydrogenase n=1 Tax=Tepiditoga spiralis TaxID=2108365 RepID=A0A7G1G4Q2_9BACT|nr:hydrogenase [Tepiditoga spiralis]BBE31510.1 hypothetical protein OSSY52_16510 [Tepiditoga spiralis]
MSILNLLLMIILFSLIFSLNSSRLRILIYTIFLQGSLVSLVPIFIEEKITITTIVFAFIPFLVKGIIIPTMLIKVLDKVIMKKELEPIVGYHASIFISVLIIVFSFVIQNKISFPISNNLLGVTAIATILSGMFLLIARRKTITQVIGYLMLENGIYLIGSMLINKSSYIVEFGILLDILVGVMIMVVILQQINIKFETINTIKLKNLKE